MCPLTCIKQTNHFHLSGSSVIVKKSVERLKLKTEDGDTELSFKTMTGQSDHSKQKTMITLKPSGTSAINLELFVIDADVTVTIPVKNISDLLPNLKIYLRQEDENNLVKRTH